MKFPTFDMVCDVGRQNWEKLKIKAIHCPSAFQKVSTGPPRIHTLSNRNYPEKVSLIQGTICVISSFQPERMGTAGIGTIGMIDRLHGDET